MAIEIAATLAADLVAKILLPYAKLGLKKVGEELKERAGPAIEAQATSLTGKVWDKVKSLFQSERDRYALEQFEESPEAAAPIFTRTLEKKLAEAPQAAEELQQLVDTPVAPDGSVTLQHIMAQTFGYVDARGASISGGQVAGVIVGAPPAAVMGPPRPPEAPLRHDR
jgi:hypothetical protein